MFAAFAAVIYITNVCFRRYIQAFSQAHVLQRSALMHAFMAKWFRLQPKVRHDMAQGSVQNMMHVDVPFDIYTHISGVDLIRDYDGQFYVLEDNLRTPSGVSYMLENRSITYRIFPDLIPKNNVLPVKDYSDRLLKNLLSLSNSTLLIFVS